MTTTRTRLVARRTGANAFGAARALLYLVAALAVRAGLAHAQPPTWHAKAQASASIFFGATDQQLVATQGDLSRADSSIEVATAVQFRYGESTDPDGVHSVHARSWLTSLNLDFQPVARFSPFLFGTLESSLEQRLARRASGGAGLKWTFVRTPVTRASLSGAILGERSRGLAAPDRPIAGVRSVARWSLRAKLDRKGEDKLSFSHVTFYQPAIDAPSNYLLTSTSQAAYALTSALALTLSFSERYDNAARARGARSNHDGQLLVGVAVAR